jgi:hypothetical protein
VDDIIDRITDFLSDKGEKSPEGAKKPYVLHEPFLSPAEHNFFSAGQALVSVKVALRDLFEVKSTNTPNLLKLFNPACILIVAKPVAMERWKIWIQFHLLLLLWEC